MPFGSEVISFQKVPSFQRVESPRLVCIEGRGGEGRKRKDGRGGGARTGGEEAC